MFRHLAATAVSLAALTLSPVPILVGPTQAQPCGAAIAGANCPPSMGSSTYQCASELGHLRRVHVQDLDEIDGPNLVSVVPICAGESFGLMRSDGNAGSLRGAIADNDAMGEALFMSNFHPEDVVGVRMTGDESVLLYVHPFHRM